MSWVWSDARVASIVDGVGERVGGPARRMRGMLDTAADSGGGVGAAAAPPLARPTALTPAALEAQAAADGAADSDESPRGMTSPLAAAAEAEDEEEAPAGEAHARGLSSDGVSYAPWEAWVVKRSALADVAELVSGLHNGAHWHSCGY